MEDSTGCKTKLKEKKEINAGNVGLEIPSVYTGPFEGLHAVSGFSSNVVSRRNSTVS